MSLTESIKRLRFTFLKQNKPNQTDVDALNEVLKAIESYQSKKVDDNRVFAKLLCLYIKESYHKNNNDINQVLMVLGNELKKPLDIHISMLSNKMTTTQIVNYINGLTIDVPTDEFCDLIALAKREDEFWNTHQKEILNEILFMNSEQSIKSNFYNTANQILNTEIYGL